MDMLDAKSERASILTLENVAEYGSNLFKGEHLKLDRYRPAPVLRKLRAAKRGYVTTFRSGNRLVGFEQSQPPAEWPPGSPPPRETAPLKFSPVHRVMSVTTGAKESTISATCGNIEGPRPDPFPPFRSHALC